MGNLKRPYLLRFADLRPNVRLPRQTVLTLEQAGRLLRAVADGERSWAVNAL